MSNKKKESACEWFNVMYFDNQILISMYNSLNNIKYDK